MLQLLPRPGASQKEPRLNKHSRMGLASSCRPGSCAYLLLGLTYC
jgi:hypothetical protein